MKEKIVNNFIYIILAIFLLLISCNDKKENVESTKQSTDVKINLPSSIDIGAAIEGDIVYSSDFDTLRLKKGERRYVFLYLTKSKRPTVSYEEFKKVQRDTFVPIENNLIPIYDIKFYTKGNMFLDGYIIDQVFLEVKNSEDEVKIITLETKIVHPISVIGKVKG